MASIITLNTISQQLNIYIGIIMFIMGVIGCLWNILIFRHHSFRLSSCCTYMLIGSIASLIQIIFGLLSRILSDGFHMDWALINIAWCKIRNYVTLCASLTALSCFVWTAMDRFFSTCRQIKWRYLNSVYIARQICVLTIIFWMVVTLPTLIYIKPIYTKGICASSSVIWSLVITYFFNLFCYAIFPWFFMCLFGISALKNLRHINRRRVNPVPLPVLTRMARIDNQLTSMLFLQIIIAIISSVPFCVQSIYNNLTQSIIKNDERQALENLILQLVRLAFYFNYISMFYVNYLSSPIFRRLSKKVLKNLCRKKDTISRDITIINHQRYEHHNRSKIARTRTPYTVSGV